MNHYSWNREKVKIRPQILERDNYSCQDCGEHPTEAKLLHIHHKDKSWDNNSPENLIILCPMCHTSRHKNTSISGKQLTCQGCKHTWPYTGKSEWYTSCPRCKTSVRVKV